MTHVAQAQVWRAQRTFHIIACVIFMRSCCVFDSPRLSLPLLAVYLLSYRLVHPLGSQLLPRCGGHSLRTSGNEDPGTFAEYDPLTLSARLVFETRGKCQDFVARLTNQKGAAQAAI